jgi:hypothetical protein
LQQVILLVVMRHQGDLLGRLERDDFIIHECSYINCCSIVSVIR